MIQTVPLNYAPDADTRWDRAPGSVYSMKGLAPLQRGYYGTIAATACGYDAYVAALDVKLAQTFRQMSGAVRTLLFHGTGIFDATSLTNVATLSAATSWSAAAWGDQIIATNNVSAVQSSTAGGAFSALTGNPPSAKFVAANANFVVLANVTGAPHKVVWSGLRNPGTWAPSWTTQAGGAYLVDTPGAITALAAFRDGFVAFKANSIYIGEYVGPSGYVFRWRCVSQRIGCVAPASVAEIDGRLYFMHYGGFYEFDGAQINNVSLPVFQTFLAESRTPADGSYGVDGGFTIGQRPAPTNGGVSVDNCQAGADDREGVYHVMLARIGTPSHRRQGAHYAFNVRTRKWARIGGNMLTTGSQMPMFVRGTTADAYDFLPNRDANVLMFGGNSYSAPRDLYALLYPATSDGTTIGQIACGPIGSFDGSSTLLRVYPEILYGSTEEPWSSCTVRAATNPLRKSPSSTDFAYNNEFLCFDGRVSNRFCDVTLTLNTTAKAVLVGMGIDAKGGGAR